MAARLLVFLNNIWPQVHQRMMPGGDTERHLCAALPSIRKQPINLPPGITGFTLSTVPHLREFCFEVVWE